MKQRMLATFLSLCLLLGLLPTVALAVPETEPVTMSVSTPSELEAALTGDQTNVIISIEQDIELTSGISISGERTIKLMGASDNITIKFADNADFTGSASGNMFYFSANSGISMTIENITIDGNHKGRLFQLDATGNGKRNSLTLNDNAVLQNGYTSANGSAVWLRSGCDFTMNDGAVIQNNTAKGYSGGVMGWSDDMNVMINGGEIKNNSGQYAGGIVLLGTYHLYLNGGTISGNSCISASYGGGVFLDGGSLHLGGTLFGDNVDPNNDDKDFYFNSNHSGRTMVTIEGNISSPITICGARITSERPGHFVDDKFTAVEGYTLKQTDIDQFQFIGFLSDKVLLLNENEAYVANRDAVVQITYNANYAGGPDAVTKQVPSDIPVALISNPFSRTGYIFVGWNTASDGTGTPYADGATLTNEVIGEGLTLYAQWISSDAVLASGSCGATDEDAVVWKLTADGTLTISGSGTMADYASKDAVPWGNYLNQIKTGVVESGITHLGARTFVLTPNLKSVELPDSLISIGESAFNQSGLASLELPQNLKTIGKNAFWHGNLSGELNIPESVETIGDFAFDQNKLTEVKLPTGLKTLGAGAFKANPLATMPEIPLKITSLTSTFQNCTELKEIDIPSHVTTLDRTFMGCTGLTTVTIPETVESYIGLFNGCTNLTSAVIESKATDIGGENDNNAYGVFGGCSSLESVVVPEHVTVIGTAAFKGCSKLKTTDFIERATSIGSGAFQNCTELHGSLNLNASAIGSVAFDGCSGLGPDISIANATTVGDSAFRNCSNLTGIVYAQKISGGANMVSTRSVTALLNGGTFTEGTEFTINTLATPIKDGCIFDGWYTKDGSQSNDWGEKVDPATVEDSTTCYAKWTESTYSVTGRPLVFGSVTYGATVEAKTITVAGPDGSGTLTAVSSDDGVFTAAASGREVTVAPKVNLDIGTYNEVITITTPDDATFFVDVSITIEQAPTSIGITAKPTSLTGGGTVTLTVTKTGLPQDAQVSVSGYSNIIDNDDGTYTVILPNTTASYTFTANYEGDVNHEAATADCTVFVTQYTGGGSSSSGGSSSGSSSVSGSGDNVIITASSGTVTDAQMESAVKKANKGSTITIKATSSTTVTLPVGGMADAADNNNDVLLDLRYGEVTLSARAIAGMTDGVSSNDKIKVSVTSQTNSKDETISDLLDKGAAVFDVTVVVDGVEIHSFDSTLTITLTVSNLAKIIDPHVLHILTDGTKEYYAPDSISGNTITVKGIRNLSTFAVIPGSEVPQNNPFVDVSTSDYYYDAVLWAVENGVTNGTSATTFSPNMAVSRAQMVTFLWRAHGSPKITGTNPFTDVSTNDYYYDAVLWAVANGVTNGTSATTFSPDAPVTRAQAVTFQWRAAGSPVVSGSSFGDVTADAYYVNAVTWAVANGITNGTSATTFSPDVVVSRAQAVTFLWRELA